MKVEAEVFGDVMETLVLVAETQPVCTERVQECAKSNIFFTTVLATFYSLSGLIFNFKLTNPATDQQSLLSP